MLKNVIDWLSRPANDIPRAFGGKAVGLMGATLGMGGTALAHAAWLPVLRTLGTQTWSGPRLYVSGAARVFDAEGRIVDRGRPPIARYGRRAWWPCRLSFTASATCATASSSACPIAFAIDGGSSPPMAA